jgi:hypothetical protein
MLGIWNLGLGVALYLVLMTSSNASGDHDPPSCQREHMNPPLVIGNALSVYNSAPELCHNLGQVAVDDLAWTLFSGSSGALEALFEF